MNRPGFVDLQVNGSFGIDFSDPSTTVEQVLRISQSLVQNGTVGLLATVMTNPREVMESCIRTIAEAIRKQRDRAPILGIHMEGPFISPEYGYRGMHVSDSVCSPDILWFERLQKIAEGHIRLVTLAPEYENSCNFIRAVCPGVIVSAGHCNCSLVHARRAVESGLTMATHIGNGCRQQIDRHDNPIVNLLACGEISLSFIPDGIHLPEGFIRMLLKSRPIDKLIVVSDAVQFAGMPTGTYTTSSGHEVQLNAEGRLSLASDPHVMAGSSATMLKCMNHLASLNILTEEELWQVGLENPLRMLGMRVEDCSRQAEGVWFDEQERRFHLPADRA
jgi:N-acetylglucosamine-6-phosphate deacetylase